MISKKPNTINAINIVTYSTIALLVISLCLCVQEKNRRQNLFNAYETPHVEQIKITNELDQKSQKCLAENLYWEARGTSPDEMIRVANVVQNRIASNKYPKTICAVVHQHKQFSWTLKKSNNPKKITKLINNPVEKRWWNFAQYISFEAIVGQLPLLHHDTAYHANYMEKPHSQFWNTKIVDFKSPFHTYYP